MNTQIVSASPAIIAALSPQETAQSLKTACGQFAMFAERGCKYIGLLRGQLIRSGEAPDEVFAIVKDALIKGGMDEKRAKSTANNGKGHSELAEFALKEGVALKETHFYGIAVGDARRVTSFLRKGGDEAIAAVNKIALTAKGGVTSKAIDKLIPPVAPAPADGEAEGEGGEGGEGADGASTKSAFDRAVIMLTSIQGLMREMTDDEADAIRELSMEFIIG